MSEASDKYQLVKNVFQESGVDISENLIEASKSVHAHIEMNLKEFL